jgi:LysM domain
VIRKEKAMVVATRLMPPVRRPRARRGEYKFLAALLAAATFLVLFAGQALGGTGSGGTTVVIQPGQSLWSVASEYPAGGDIRSRIEELMSVNHLADGSTLVAGQTLFVPSN